MSGVYNVIFFGALVAAILLLNAGMVLADETTCEQRFLDKYGTSHSACLPASPQLTASGVSEADKALIVDRHNTHRRAVTPTASNMLKMSWDDGIAKIAQGWANTCPSGHDDSAQRRDYERYEDISQNMGLGQADWTAVIDAWNGEKSFYNYATNGPTEANKTIGHYTQVVWASSFKIGCGFALCGTSKIYVCNYAPSGNYIGEWPYKAGDSCADCPNKCNDKLCDCGNVDCYSDGRREFKIADCSCNCLHNLVAPDCTVDCSNVNEPSYCTTWEHSCKWGYQFKCAIRCGICPAS